VLFQIVDGTLLPTSRAVTNHIFEPVVEAMTRELFAAKRADNENDGDAGGSA
jgi:hypothetical protein